MANQATIRSFFTSGDDGNGTMTYGVQYAARVNAGSSGADNLETSFTAGETASASQLKSAAAAAVRAHVLQEYGKIIGTDQVILQDGTRL